MSSIFRIQKESGGESEQAKKLFREFNLEDAADQAQTEEVLRVGNLAEDAAQSAVPIRTGELRAAITLKRDGSDVTIDINQNPHGPDRKGRVTNDQLADILYKGTHHNGTPFKRTQGSRPASPFVSVPQGSPTADWAAKAQADLTKELNS